MIFLHLTVLPLDPICRACLPLWDQSEEIRILATWPTNILQLQIHLRIARNRSQSTWLDYHNHFNIPLVTKNVRSRPHYLPSQTQAQTPTSTVDQLGSWIWGVIQCGRWLYHLVYTTAFSSYPLSSIFTAPCFHFPYILWNLCSIRWLNKDLNHNSHFTLHFF